MKDNLRAPHRDFKRGGGKGLPLPLQDQIEQITGGSWKGRRSRSAPSDGTPEGYVRVMGVDQPLIE